MVVAITSVSFLFATSASSSRAELADSHPATDVMWRDVARAGFFPAISSLGITDFDLPFFESLRHLDAYHILDSGRGTNWLAATSRGIQGLVREGIFKKAQNTFVAIVVSTFRLENIRQWILFRTRCTCMSGLSLFFAGFSDIVIGAFILNEAPVAIAITPWHIFSWRCHFSWWQGCVSRGTRGCSISRNLTHEFSQLLYGPVDTHFNLSSYHNLWIDIVSRMQGGSCKWGGMAFGISKTWAPMFARSSFTGEVTMRSTKKKDHKIVIVLYLQKSLLLVESIYTRDLSMYILWYNYVIVMAKGVSSPRWSVTLTRMFGY